jgi:electron transfer flavoprotein beta subunit
MGSNTSDSDTAQVGPQLAEELGFVCAAYVRSISIRDTGVVAERICDGYKEVLEMTFPCLVGVSTGSFLPRYMSMGGLEDAFDNPRILRIGAQDIGLDPEEIGSKGSPTRIVDVYSLATEKKNVVFKGSPKKVVDDLFERFGETIGSAAGMDIQEAHE